MEKIYDSLSHSIAHHLPASLLDTKHHDWPQWMQECQHAPAWQAIVEVAGLLQFLLEHSPYLSSLIRQYPEMFSTILTQGCDEAYLQWCATREAWAPNTLDEAQFMRYLRTQKATLALLLGVAEILDAWPLMRICEALSELADWAVQSSVDYLLYQAHARAEIVLPQPDAPSDNSGVIILGMGKLGARELNYSSDIDLIIFYEKDRVVYQGRYDTQRFFSKLALDLVRLMQERTKEGYVFRTDLRLRPDPSSTPPAMSVNAAFTYYETVGQNWERAAMIKARPMAGDKTAGENFLKELRPFIWRKYLDFAAITDILSIKRQMHVKAGTEVALEGHNIKTGVGGIREIEFFAQVHQLIWGGREPDLRGQRTLEVVDALVEKQLVPADQAAVLKECYGFFRKVEHRLQMRADEQTHRLPESHEGLERLARFCHYADFAAFEAELLPRLHSVYQIFESAFAKEMSLGAEEGRLVFTGADEDEGTLKSLRAMGFENPEKVWHGIANWHRGARRATRTKRARELITEVTPALLKALSGTGQPDAAFHKMDEFLERLPAGVQLFALLSNHPQLLQLVAQIMGGAPALADKLSRSPALLDTVLSGDLHEESSINSFVIDLLKQATHVDEALDILCRAKNEQSFWIGTQLLRQRMTSVEAMGHFSALGRDILSRVVETVSAAFVQDYGAIEGGKLAVLALGRLGAGEMTPSSDLDLIFIYDAPDMSARSDGKRSYDARVYYNRLSQRIVNALTTLGRYGRLYEVDARLRPSGQDGHLAVSLEGFGQYLRENAWTFEKMALIKADRGAGDLALAQAALAQADAFIRSPQDAAQLLHDVADLRLRVAKEYPPANPLALKYAQGGLLEADFLAQGTMLMSASKPEVMPRNSADIFTALWPEEEALRAAYHLQRKWLFVHRLCCGDTPIEITKYSAGTRDIILQTQQAPSMEALLERLEQAQTLIHEKFMEVFESAQTA